MRVCPFKKITDSKEQNCFPFEMAVVSDSYSLIQVTQTCLILWGWECTELSVLFSSSVNAKSLQLKLTGGKTATYSSNEPWDLQLGLYSLTLHWREERFQNRKMESSVVKSKGWVLFNSMWAKYWHTQQTIKKAIYEKTHREITILLFTSTIHYTTL